MSKAQQAAPGLLVHPGIFNETLSLLFQAHEFFQARAPHEMEKLTDVDKLHFSNEMTRITMRLTGVMAWVMVRRAVCVGRIEDAKASDVYHLDGADICLVDLHECFARFPQYMRYLGYQSLKLYERAHRLDQNGRA